MFMALHKDLCDFLNDMNLSSSVSYQKAKVYHTCTKVTNGSAICSEILFELSLLYVYQTIWINCWQQQS